MNNPTKIAIAITFTALAVVSPFVLDGGEPQVIQGIDGFGIVATGNRTQIETKLKEVGDMLTAETDENDETYFSYNGKKTLVYIVVNGNTPSDVDYSLAYKGLATPPMLTFTDVKDEAYLNQRLDQMLLENGVINAYKP